MRNAFLIWSPFNGSSGRRVEVGEQGGGENMIISWEFGILYEFALLGDR